MKKSWTKPTMCQVAAGFEISRYLPAEIATEIAGAAIDDIQALNPELRRWTTPVRTPVYDLKVPVGTGDALRARDRDDALARARIRRKTRAGTHCRSRVFEGSLTADVFPAKRVAASR